MRRALLAVLYFAAVTPAGKLHRLIADPLTLRRDRNAASYWSFTDGARRGAR
ncbi:hypothetical protein [Kitasatospora sp. HPMI-4]|uniref:hypothetical protein n=1 Tax=Kitasatospora sp. HPMI-4 TaxID=3448443 RepID=UPI003F1C5F4D